MAANIKISILLPIIRPMFIMYIFYDRPTCIYNCVHIQTSRFKLYYPALRVKVLKCCFSIFRFSVDGPFGTCSDVSSMM